mmetsp:Transcript_3043/g.4435  ORF Transcript_3043/g.4435 Transcript_3043/m.4435 type:complete len:234 (-) Transcript_3043:107-808(-)
MYVQVSSVPWMTRPLEEDFRTFAHVNTGGFEFIFVRLRPSFSKRTDLPVDDEAVAVVAAFEFDVMEYGSPAGKDTTMGSDDDDAATRTRNCDDSLLPPLVLIRICFKPDAGFCCCCFCFCLSIGSDSFFNKAEGSFGSSLFNRLDDDGEEGEGFTMEVEESSLFVVSVVAAVVLVVAVLLSTSTSTSIDWRLRFLSLFRSLFNRFFSSLLRALPLFGLLDMILNFDDGTKQHK